MAKSILSKCIDMYAHQPQGLKSHLRVTGDGVGVHRTLSTPLSLPRAPKSQPALCSMASARLLAAVPSVVLWSSLRAAGVKFPAASERRGVILGGAIVPFFPESGVFANRSPRIAGLNISLLARRLRDALSESLWDIASRAEISGMWKGVAGSPVWLIILGVESSVPHVTSCFNAAGPNSAGVGDGRFGTSPKFRALGDLGWSGIRSALAQKKKKR